MIAGEEGNAAKIFSAIEGIPVRMISYGGSKHNISVLINTDDKQRTLQALSDKLLN
jgi:aspartate kinase